MPRRPAIIAHRGASGYLPEHTAQAKALAYGQGADYLEQDVVATRDGSLIVLHDVFLERVTDVSARFPHRQRPDGHFYAIDFELEEIRALRVNERRRADGLEQQYPGRFPADRGQFAISTLAEEIELIQGLNFSTGREVGLYAEIKEPRWHATHGIDLSKLLLDELASYGYRRAADLVFVQCFDAAELKRLRGELGTALKLVQLVDKRPEHKGFLDDKGLAAIARYADALGPPFLSLVCGGAGEGGADVVASATVRGAHDAGLLLHPYTFRKENLPPFAGSLEELLRLYMHEIGVDGVFCDYPDIAFAARKETAGN
jgi:glycerophosphoryl diester phosphodiesterase